MQLKSQMAAIGLMVQMCGSTAPNTNTEATGYSCNDYQIMINVEMILARECGVDSECTQVLAEETCGSNSVITNADYESDYFYELLEGAEAIGCEIDLPRNEDCSVSAAVCDVGVCRWQ